MTTIFLELHKTSIHPDHRCRRRMDQQRARITARAHSGKSHSRECLVHFRREYTPVYERKVGVEEHRGSRNPFGIIGSLQYARPNLQGRRLRHVHTADSRHMRVQGRHRRLWTVGSIRETKTCLYTMTNDRNFIVDSLASRGHPHVFAAVLGKILAELAITGRTDVDISHFSVDRPAVTDVNYAFWRDTRPASHQAAKL
ncbi:unnamed protein product [Sphagnum balticum]